MKVILRILLFVLPFVTTLPCLAQDPQRSGEHAVRPEDCAKVRKWSRKLLKVSDNSALFELLGDCDCADGKWASGNLRYQQAQEVPGCNAIVWKKRALALEQLLQFDQAIESMKSYTGATGDTLGMAGLLHRCMLGQAQRARLWGKFQVEKLPTLNSYETEIAACKREGELFFYSRAPQQRLGSNAVIAKDRPAFNLYLQPADASHQEGCLSLSPKCATDELGLGMAWDHNTGQFYLTKHVTMGDHAGKSCIYRSKKNQRGVVEETNLDFFEHLDANCFHPAIDPTGQLMVFASDNETWGVGGSDLYYTLRERGKGWSFPLPLGDGINTKEDESYPCFSSNGRLYFSSNGQPGGLGGIDIYYCDYSLRFLEVPQSRYPVPHFQVFATRNAGQPINSYADDFAMVWDPHATDNIGYFSSNRGDSIVNSEGKAMLGPISRRCDIYKFQYFPEIMGRVHGSDSELVPYPVLKLVEEGFEPRSISSDHDGRFGVLPRSHGSLELLVAAPGFFSRSMTIDLAALLQGQDLHLDIALEKSPWQVVELLHSADSFPQDTNPMEVFLTDNLYPKPQTRRILMGLDTIMLRRDLDYNIRIRSTKATYEIRSLASERIDPFLTIDLAKAVPTSEPSKPSPSGAASTMTNPPPAIPGPAASDTSRHWTYFYEPKANYPQGLDDRDQGQIQAALASSPQARLLLRMVVKAHGSAELKQKYAKTRLQALHRLLARQVPLASSRMVEEIVIAPEETCRDCSTESQRKKSRVEIYIQSPPSTN